MTNSTMRPPTSTRNLVSEHRKASKRFMKRATRSPAAARAYLKRAGILDKKGNLAKPYRVW